MAKYQPETPAEKLAYRMGVKHTRRRMLHYLHMKLGYYWQNQHAREWLGSVRDWVADNIKG